jgi:hypothetical protein
MRIFSILTGLLVGVLASLSALAAGPTATLQWSNPTTYIDGTPLPVTDIASYTITWTRPGSSVTSGTLNVTGPATTATVPGLVCGNFSFTMTVTTTAAAADPNATSNPTNAAPYATAIKCIPNPVTGVTVS